MPVTESRPTPVRADAPDRQEPSSERTAPGTVAAVACRGALDRLPLTLVLSVFMLGMGLLVGLLWVLLEQTFTDLQDQLPEGFDALLGGVSLATPAGWANAEILAVVAPAAVIAVAAITASRSIAAEEQRTTLGVILAAPVGRVSFLLARALTGVALVAVVALATWGGLLVADLSGNLGLSGTGMVAAVVHLAFLGFCFTGIGVTVAAVTGSPRLTAAITGGLGALAFVTAVFAPLLDSLAWARWASPWFYYDSASPLLAGAEVGHLAVLGAATLVLTRRVRRRLPTTRPARLSSPTPSTRSGSGPVAVSAVVALVGACRPAPPRWRPVTRPLHLVGHLRRSRPSASIRRCPAAQRPRRRGAGWRGWPRRYLFNAARILTDQADSAVGALVIIVRCWSRSSVPSRCCGGTCCVRARRYVRSATAYRSIPRCRSRSSPSDPQPVPGEVPGQVVVGHRGQERLPGQPQDQRQKPAPGGLEMAEGQPTAGRDDSRDLGQEVLDLLVRQILKQPLGHDHGPPCHIPPGASQG